jgi:hypothetical protein
MRTTVTLEPDVAAAVDSLCGKRHVGVSAAINELIQTGLREGARIDIANVADALEILDGPSSR